MYTTENIVTSGNQNQPDVTSDRPLVTFALFAYNQEKFIREAIEGAFSQTYDPLEIILSDDCSSDRTFEIMQEMAAAYKGPHRIIVRRNDWNVGTAQHVYSAFRLSQGLLFVVAAGDDVSLPARVDILVKSWIDRGNPCAILHSARTVFFENTDNPNLTYAPKVSKNGVINDYLKGDWLPSAAPTCAYTRQIFENFPPLSGGSIIEDMPLFLRGALIAEFIAVNVPLVMQRNHEDNNGTGYTLDSPARWNRFIRSLIIAYTDMKRDLFYAQTNLSFSVRNEIEMNLIKSIKGISVLILPETRRFSLIEKFLFFVKMATSKTLSNSFIGQLKFTLVFFRLDNRLLRLLQRYTKMLKSNLFIGRKV